MPSLDRWTDVWQRLGAASADRGTFERLMACYAKPQRHYHTLRHLDECLDQLDALRGAAVRPAEVELALWFHDAVYDTRRHDNEARSVQWARDAMHAARVQDAVAQRVHDLIMVTRHDAQPHDLDAKVMVDVDLSILGAITERFDEYERQIRAEYAWVPGVVFRATRRKLLQGFLARPSIFNTAPFVAAYEGRARANLQRALERLERR